MALSRKSIPSNSQTSLGNYFVSRSNTFEKHITVTNSDFRFIVTEQLQNIGVDPVPLN